MKKQTHCLGSSLRISWTSNLNAHTLYLQSQSRYTRAWNSSRRKLYVWRRHWNRRNDSSTGGNRSANKTWVAVHHSASIIFAKKMHCVYIPVNQCLNSNAEYWEQYKMDEIHYRLRRGRSIQNLIFTLRQISEKVIKLDFYFHLAFRDHEKMNQEYTTRIIAVIYTWMVISKNLNGIPC